ncbi:hypothetical protein LIER_33779 [Lithospermum erythrorhizon]
MLGVDPKISLHKFHLDPSYKLVKQKNRNFSEEKNLTIRGEVDELIKAGAIREFQFLEWISNVVMVKKSNEKWRMCTYFTNLNKACRNDYYPYIVWEGWWTEPRVTRSLISCMLHEDTIKYSWRKETSKRLPS